MLRLVIRNIMIGSVMVLLARSIPDTIAIAYRYLLIGHVSR
jgi:hypothetical protein